MNEEYIGKIIPNIDKRVINKIGKETFLYSIELLYYEIINSATNYFIYKETKKTNQDRFKTNIKYILQKIHE